MKKVKIITDSCCDLSKELLEKYDIDYARMSTVLDGVESPALITWTSQEVHDFYENMRNGKKYSTAQVSVEEFNLIFKKYLDEDYDIVYIACSSKQSGSVNTGTVVANKILEDYPQSKIFCIDSLNSSIGEGMLAIEAAKMASENMSAEQITDYINSIKKTVLEYVTVHTLDYLKRAGRVSGSSAFFGNLMGVKPIIVADANGAQAAFKKVKGRQNSIKEIVSLLKENLIDGENQTVYIVHADCPNEDVETLKDVIKQEINCKDIYVVYIGPIVGASVGPDAIGVFGYGKTVTFAAE